MVCFEPCRKSYLSTNASLSFLTLFNLPFRNLTHQQIYLSRKSKKMYFFFLNSKKGTFLFTKIRIAVSNQMMFFIIWFQFKEFEPRFKFETRLKYGWFDLKLYLVYWDLSRAQLEPVFGGLETRFEFFKSGLI